MRDGAAAAGYLLSPRRGGPLRLLGCPDAHGAERELATVDAGRPGRARIELAGAILADVMVGAPTAKIARDYSRFLPLPEAEEVRIGGGEVVDWLAGWRPPLAIGLWPFR